MVIMTVGPTLPKFDFSYFLESDVPAVPQDVVDRAFQKLNEDRTKQMKSTDGAGAGTSESFGNGRYR